VVLGAAPLIWTGSFAHALLSQMGIAIVVCLAYNVLLGQGGMLSFGHAVYSGLGAYLAMHALNRVGQGAWALPVSAIPLVGGCAGLAFAALLGHVSTRKAGTPFAMITLGVGELVGAVALMLPDWFGGEGGLSGNRVVGPAVWGLSFGPQIELYGLIAIYCFVCTGALFAFTRTPLGRMLNAVRDNPHRVGFIGYNARRVRHLAFMVSGFFAGIGGGLAALHFEIVSTEVVGSARSGAYLLFVFLGGSAFFIGPVIGAVLMVLALVLLSSLTPAWQLYLGLVFLLMVMTAPGGVASLLAGVWRLAVAGRLRALLGAGVALGSSALVALWGGSAAIEMLYRRQLDAAQGPILRHLGTTLDTRSAASWTIALALAAAGAALFTWCLRRSAPRWRRAWEDIEAERVAGKRRNA
jgi:branched-chain amino acid transport system permease protein